MSIESVMYFTYLLGFLGFSYILWKNQNVIRFYRRIVEDQRKIMLDDLEMVKKAQESVVNTIKITNRIVEDPDKYQKEIEELKQTQVSLDEIQKKYN